MPTCARRTAEIEQTALTCCVRFQRLQSEAGGAKRSRPLPDAA
jgi:hypothetical protein